MIYGYKTEYCRLQRCSVFISRMYTALFSCHLVFQSEMLFMNGKNNHTHFSLHVPVCIFRPRPINWVGSNKGNGNTRSAESHFFSGTEE